MNHSQEREGRSRCSQVRCEDAAELRAAVLPPALRAQPQTGVAFTSAVPPHSRPPTSQPARPPDAAHARAHARMRTRTDAVFPTSGCQVSGSYLCAMPDDGSPGVAQLVAAGSFIVMDQEEVILGRKTKSRSTGEATQGSELPFSHAVKGGGKGSWRRAAKSKNSHPRDSRASRKLQAPNALAGR